MTHHIWPLQYDPLYLTSMVWPIIFDQYGLTHYIMICEVKHWYFDVEFVDIFSDARRGLNNFGGLNAAMNVRRTMTG